MLSLDDLGWSPRLEAAFAEHRSAGLSPARVSLEHTHIYRVLTPDGELLARVSGRLRHDALERADFPAVGDWVAIDPPQPDAEARIRAVLPRSSRFSRRRGRQSHRGAGARRQHRHRLSRLGPRLRFQPATNRALSADRLGQRRRASHRAEQGGPRRRSAHLRRAGRRVGSRRSRRRRVRQAARVDGRAPRASWTRQDGGAAWVRPVSASRRSRMR